MWRESAALAVEDRMFRALAVLRVVVLANAVGLNLWRFENFQHPVAGALVVAAMVVWTAVAIWAYDAPRRRVPWLLLVDLSLAMAALAASPLLKGDGFRATVPGFWVAGALFAWAVHWRWRGGLAAGVGLSVVDLAARSEITQTNYGHVFLLLIGGPIVGYLCGSLQEMAVERDRAERAAAAAAERARLARAVHDGVLQVLALVQRRGTELGGTGAELGRLAGEQEQALRVMIRQQDSVPDTSRPDDRTDLVAALEQLGTRHPPRTVVSGPGTPVALPRQAADDLVAVVAACLDNVARHVGDDAPAWVLLEDLGDRVVVTVRDEGPGIPPGRLEQAADEGRLGVSGSILGRITDLGGTAELATGAFGTEWELTLPRPDATEEDV
ncbi:MacS family sensor histidine kinase [Nocardioides pacificus]